MLAIIVLHRISLELTSSIKQRIDSPLLTLLTRKLGIIYFQLLRPRPSLYFFCAAFQSATAFFNCSSVASPKILTPNLAGKL